MEEETANRPKWLLELENRKRKPHLAHETGAGAPCINCNSACPGLDLHFWRKICKNCKCGRDDHDVSDDEFPQFDLLFGPSGKFKNKSIHLQVNNKKQSDETFEWVPPDISKELAMDYMKALPVEKLPIKGSVGAALRRQLLQKQLPLHDIDYKLLGAQPFDSSRMTSLINATNKQRCNLQYKSHIPPSTGVHLRIPSTFVQNSCADPQNRQEATVKIDNQVPTVQGCNYSLDNMSINSNIVKSQPIEGRFYENSRHADNIPVNEGSTNSEVVNSLITSHLAEQETVPTQEVHTSGEYASSERRVPTHSDGHGQALNNNAPCRHSLHSAAVDRETASIAESILTDALLPPSAIHANDIIGSTLDERELMFIREKLTDKYSAVECPAIHGLPKSSRSLDTSEVSSVHSAKDFASIKDAEKLALKNPDRNLALTEKTEIGSQYSINGSPLQAELNSSVLPSTIIHSEQLQNQIFPHIVEGPNESVQNAQYTECLKNIESLKINSTKAQKCEKCHEDIYVGDVAVIVEKANNASWHPGCFVCSMCNELLADLVYFYYKNTLYCGRDLATFLGIPRCFACDELIFVREYTVAEGHNYHVKHFCCWDCDIPLAGQQYITENDRPLCLSCYQTSYAKTCATCNVVIAADQQGVAIKNLNFHATEACFCCYGCKKNLLNGRMAIKENKLFCSKECIAKCLNR
ncbi:hypothetical protein DMN91_004075 [Ooceraea biroi]|uniref:Prickle-like protein n=1 Tax=Ooceraea biroi TaxID=2015173 RepID=A0A3L8DTW2_OOCBI|nr:hypothetical protein DMN91_004075 [Ooceraea biroi]